MMSLAQGAELSAGACLMIIGWLDLLLPLRRYLEG